MTTVVYDRERRSSRAFLRVKLAVSGKNYRGKRFRQACETVLVSEHGGLICLPQEVEVGADLVITSPFTQEEQECRVVFVGDESEKGWRVGVEFLTPAPRFWGREFLAPAAARLVPVSQET
jgi:PilZ domain